MVIFYVHYSIEINDKWLFLIPAIFDENFDE
jgi:hypothetical protein